MHSTPYRPRRRWDGSRTGSHPHRLLHPALHNGSPVLRSGRVDRCRDCGNIIEWYQGTDGSSIPFHPKELPAAFVPETGRWHVSSGIAYPAGDGTAWCRLPHAALCPAGTPEPATEALTVLRRYLAMRTHDLIEAGRFAPQQQPCTTPHRACRPARPIVQILGIPYLAARPLQNLQCLARTCRTRARCLRPLADPSTPPGTWRLLPVTAITGRSSLPGQPDVAVYDLTGLPYAEQLRWRSQRCPRHALARAATAITDWEPFNPLVHHEHIHTRLPDQAAPDHAPAATPAGRCRYA